MSEAKDGVVVICMKWGTLYGPDYVNVLYAAVADNIRLPFRFVCLTDDANGLREEVEAFPIPDLGLRAKHFSFGGWPKLCVFAADVYELQGRCLFIDLDTIITSDITPFFEYKDGICLIREWRRTADYFRKWKKNGATGVMAFTFGQDTNIYDQFIDDIDAATSCFRSEQRFVTAYARNMNFWPHPWVVSFKRHLLAAPILNRIIPPQAPAPDVKMVAFHGTPRPIDIIADKDQPWGNWGRYGRGAVDWARDYWLKYGGADPS